MYTTRNLISDIWSYLQAYKGRFVVATVCRVLADLAWLYPPYAFSIIINFFSKDWERQSLTPVYVAFGFTFVAIVIRYVCSYTAKTLIYRIAEKVNLDTQLRSVKHLMLIDMAWHEKESAGSKYKRIERGAYSISRILRMWINNAIEIAINLVGIVVILLKMDIGMGVAITLFLVTYYLFAMFFRVRAVAVSDIVNAKEENRSGMLFEAINNIRSVKVMSMMEKILDILSHNAQDLYETIKRRIFWFQTGNMGQNFYAHLFRFSVMVYIIYGVVQGRYEIGFLVLFVGYFGNVLESMNELTEVAEEFAIGKNAVSRMQAIFQVPIKIDREKGKVKFPKSWKRIVVKNVTFAYDEKPVLDNLSFELKQGEKVGIVGLSGSGKSTLFKLLLKERETYDGEICFDNVPLKKVSKKDYFRNLAVVLQETELFNASLRENITITNHAEEKNETLLKKAIEIAHVQDFMLKLPKGLETVIGEKGVKLSGGEKQRVGIARAIFKNPQILLLDEATSHLDIESEEKIQDSLKKFFKTVTAIVIAHRLTTIKEMDKIIVIEAGKIVEVGSFSELYAKKGRFFELWEKQKL